MTALPTLKLRVAPTFPSTVIGAGGTTVTKTAGVYTISSPILAGADPSASIGLTAINGVATTFVRSDGAPALSQAIVPTWTGRHTFNPASGDAVTINPAAASTAKGLNITQTGPATTPTGPISYNLVSLTNAASVTSPSTLTNGMLNAETRGFHVEMVDSSTTTVAAALTAHMVSNTGTPGGDKVAIIGNAYTSKAISGFLLGIDAVASVDTGGSTPYLVAAQFETAFLGSGTATNRIGVQVTNDTSAQASGLDAAIAIDNNGTSGGAFKKGISFGSPISTVACIDSAGDAIFAQQAMSIANFANCANFTFTGTTPFNFGAPFSIANLNNQNASTQILLNNTNAGTSTFVQFVASNGANQMTAGIGGIAALPALYTGRAYITGNGAALVAGTNSAQPFIQIINNAEAGRWDSATPGQLDLGVSGTLAGALQLLNATSGSITIKPPAGALGTIALVAPATAGTLLTTSNATGTISTASNSLGADVALNNTANYFDGPSAAQGTGGTWFASGTVTLTDTAGAGTYHCKLWDGTTVIDSCVVGGYGAANVLVTASLSGVLTSPTANIRISVKDIGSTSGKILFNQSGNSKDSTITAIRIN